MSIWIWLYIAIMVLLGLRSIRWVEFAKRNPVSFGSSWSPLHRIILIVLILIWPVSVVGFLWWGVRVARSQQ